MTSLPYDAADNSRRGYEFWVAVDRDLRVREGAFEPDSSKPHEVRWSKEGPVRLSHLDTVREAPHG